MTLVERGDGDHEADPTKTDPTERLGVPGSKEDSKYGREDSTTSGEVESFEDERKFR